VRIVITAGPTREYIDDVRFISNPSSGKMGCRLAEEALRRGHAVRLLAGPTCLEPPEGAEVAAFETVDELQGLVVKALQRADCLVMAAAVGDYKPLRRIRGKIKKGRPLTLKLVSTTDVLASVAPAKGKRIFVGFAVEVKDSLRNARRKVKAKGVDFLVLNSPESFGSDKARFTLVFPDGRTRRLGIASKEAAAAAILDEVESLFQGR